MIQIFENIPDEVKNRAEFMFNMSIQQPLPVAAKMLNEYINACSDEEEKEFVEFYFNMRMEQLNGSNNNQR